MISQNKQNHNIPQQFVQALLAKVQDQIQQQEIIKKLPAYNSDNLISFQQETFYSYNRPRPNNNPKINIYNDLIPNSLISDTYKPRNIPVVNKNDHIQNRTFYPQTSQTRRPHFNTKIARLNFSNINQDKPIKLFRQSTKNIKSSQTSRSIMQEQRIEGEIKLLRNNLTKKSAKEYPIEEMKKNKRIPAKFTFDYSGALLFSRSVDKRETVNSPLRQKSISINLISKRIKKDKSQEEPSLISVKQKPIKESNDIQEIMRKSFSNSQKRQSSHIPYLKLSPNTKFIEQNYVLKAEQINNDQLTHSHFPDMMSQNQVNKKQDEKKIELTNLVQGRRFSLRTKINHFNPPRSHYMDRYLDHQVGN